MSTVPITVSAASMDAPMSALVLLQLHFQPLPLSLHLHLHLHLSLRLRSSWRQEDPSLLAGARWL